ncbi:MAG: hypothetical protein ACYS26_11155 [Planctomycetota bacterium]|jgi:hypothetical protein
MKRTLLLGAVATAIASTAGAQTYETLSYESFDYADLSGLGGQAGGQNFFQPWFSGGGGTDAITTFPGTDAIGGKATTNANNGGSFRLPKTGSWPTIAPGFQFGGDAVSTIWISFDMQKGATAGDRYGGVSLNLQFVGEALFIGSPFETNEVGVGIPGCCSLTVPGSDVTQQNRVVVRIDYGPGDDRIQLWNNPGTDKPTGGADIDTLASLGTWNEYRLQSGEPADGTSFGGFSFDDFRVECEDCTEPTITGGGDVSVSAGGSVDLRAQFGPGSEGQLYWILGSASGSTPGTPFEGQIVPLNVDSYTLLTLNPGTPPLANNFGTLDLDGFGTATFSLPANSDPSFAGITGTHAALLLDLSSGALVITAGQDTADVNLLP